MTITRTTHRTVNFFYPFRLEGHDGLYSAGSYEVETLEELDIMAATRSYKKVECKMTVWSGSGKDLAEHTISVEPSILEAALMLDSDPMRDKERARMIGKTEMGDEGNSTSSTTNGTDPDLASPQTQPDQRTH